MSPPSLRQGTATSALLRITFYQSKRLLTGPAVVHPEYKWSIWVAYPIYLICMMEFGIGCVRRFDFYAKRYGTLDENNIGRDRIPDDAVGQLATGLLAYLIGRTAAEFMLKWDQNAQPINAFSLWTPVRYFIWLLAMDYFFYACVTIADEGSRRKLTLSPEQLPPLLPRS